MNLAAQNQIIAMNQRIDKRLENAPLAVIRHFNARIGSLHPAHFHIPSDKTDPLIEQNNQAAGVFRAVERIDRAAAFVETVPARAEQAAVPDGRIVRKQSAGICQLSARIAHAERLEKLVFHAAARPCLIPLAKL